MKLIRCFMHNYSQWSLGFNTKVKRVFGNFGDTSVVEVVAQERVCTRCGYVDFRVIREGNMKDYNDRS